MDPDEAGTAPFWADASVLELGCAFWADGTTEDAEGPAEADELGVEAGTADGVGDDERWVAVGSGLVEGVPDGAVVVAVLDGLDVGGVSPGSAQATLLVPENINTRATKRLKGRYMWMCQSDEGECFQQSVLVLIEADRLSSQ